VSIHLKERKYYEDAYDHFTVEWGRRNLVHYEKFYLEFTSKLPDDDQIDRPGNAALTNLFYMQTVGDALLDRYESRERDITKQMAKDKTKDEQIVSARLAEEPYCHHCHKQGLRITDKMLMHRSEDATYDDPEDVLFMLHCPHCDKNSTFWEDGTPRKSKPTLCEKCKTEMTHKTSKAKTAVTITYTCPSCGHNYKGKLALTSRNEKPDPDYDKDRVYFCLLDKAFRDRLFAIRDGFEEAARLGRMIEERQANQHIYDAIAEIKKPKIAELSTILASILEKAGYIEFRLDKPEMGKDVTVGFSCLDNKSERSDYDSEKGLKKTVQKALEDTNWRLMSDGIRYRLGYLSGRLRAYEREEDLKALITRGKKPNAKLSDPSKVITDNRGTEIIL